MAYIENITLQDLYMAIKSYLNSVSRPTWVDGATRRLNVATVTTVTTVTAVTNCNAALPTLVADQASAAITTTTTSATIIPGLGAAYQYNIAVTAASGTTAGMDFVIQESADTGINWYNVYQLPRIKTTGSYNSPVLPLTGNRLRYIQTITGTTPSFTRSINRLESSWTGVPIQRQMFDRTISLNSTGATSATQIVEGCLNGISMDVNIVSAVSAPTIGLQISSDGTAFYTIGSPVVAAPGSSVSLLVSPFPAAQAAQAIVLGAGSSASANFVKISAW